MKRNLFTLTFLLLLMPFVAKADPWGKGDEIGIAILQLFFIVILAPIMNVYLFSFRNRRNSKWGYLFYVRLPLNIVAFIVMILYFKHGGILDDHPLSYLILIIYPIFIYLDARVWLKRWEENA
jgi:peptidoglycan/LPS O-acetylase OafA/YrhL